MYSSIFKISKKFSNSYIKPNLQKLEDVPDLKHFLTDNFNRMHNYLRISLTEKCNLRCQVIILDLILI